VTSYIYEIDHARQPYPSLDVISTNG